MEILGKRLKNYSKFVGRNIVKFYINFEKISGKLSISYIKVGPVSFATKKIVKFYIKFEKISGKLSSSYIQGVSGKFCDNAAKTVKKKCKNSNK